MGPHRRIVRLAVAAGAVVRRGREALLLAIALAVPLGCGDSGRPAATPVSGTFVGEASGGDAFVAVVAGKENVVAYVCNGGRGIVRLFEGRRTGGRMEVEDRGARLSASLAADGVSGTISLPGRRPLEFSAEPAAGRAGLYWIPRQRPVDAAWVVLNDGRQRGTLAGTTLDTSTRTATLRGQGTVSVALVSPARVSATGFGGGGFGQFGS